MTVDLQERLTHDIVRLVVDGTANLRVFCSDVGNQGLEAIRFSTDRLMLATPNDHPLDSRDSVKLSHALEFVHIGLHEGSTRLDFLRHQFRHSSYVRSLRIQVRSFEARCRIIVAGLGISVVQESAVRRHVQTMDITRLKLEDEWALRDRSVLVRDRHAMPRSVQTLIDMLVEAGTAARPSAVGYPADVSALSSVRTNGCPFGGHFGWPGWASILFEG